MMLRSTGNMPGYLNYYLSSRSKFDLHSPFVYELYSKVLKDKNEYPGYKLLEKQYPGSRPQKYYRLLYRLARWFRPENVCFIGNYGSVEEQYLRSGSSESRMFRLTDKADVSFDLVFLDLQSFKEPVGKCFSLLRQHLANGSVFIIWSVKDPSELKKNWNLVQTLPGITVTIDLFYAGLVFLNTNLSREDFRIRF